MLANPKSRAPSCRRRSRSRVTRGKVNSRRGLPTKLPKSLPETSDSSGAVAAQVATVAPWEGLRRSGRARGRRARKYPGNATQNGGLYEAGKDTVHGDFHIPPELGEFQSNHHVGIFCLIVGKPAVIAALAHKTVDIEGSATPFHKRK